MAEIGTYRELKLPARYGGAAAARHGRARPDRRTRRRAAAGWRRSWSTRWRRIWRRGEQSLLFLNRRGYAPLTLCRRCGYRFQCPNCTAWMVEHRFTRRLACHHCGHMMPAPETCPECKEEDALVACGPGVERIADEVAALFPDARTAIVTSDTIWSPAKAAEFVARMEAGEIDIVDRHPARHQGLSFPEPDPGRRGRRGSRPRRRRPARGRAHLPADPAGLRPGRARRQAWPGPRPDPRSVGRRCCARWSRGDAEGFYAAETEARREAAMPPFGRLAAIIVSQREPGRGERGRAGDRPGGAGAVRIWPSSAPPPPRSPCCAAATAFACSSTPRAQCRCRRSSATGSAACSWKASTRVTVDVDPYSFL